MVSKVNLAARRALGSLVGKAKALGGLSYTTYTYLYDTLVAPVMDYSSCMYMGFRALQYIRSNPE